MIRPGWRVSLLAVPRSWHACGQRCGWIAPVDVEHALRLTNRNMIAFDLVLGSAAILAPAATLAVLGHDRPSPDAEHLFRRCGPIWLTFAAAHAVADRRGDPQDWWALAWLRGTELATDVAVVALAGLLAPGGAGRAVARRRGQPGDDDRLRLAGPARARRSSPANPAATRLAAALLAGGALHRHPAALAEAHRLGELQPAAPDRRRSWPGPRRRLARSCPAPPEAPS